MDDTVWGGRPIGCGPTRVRSFGALRRRVVITSIAVAAGLGACSSNGGGGSQGDGSDSGSASDSDRSGNSAPTMTYVTSIPNVALGGYQETIDVAYLGGDWLLNFPRAVDFDVSGNMYVSSSYQQQIVIFDGNRKVRGSIAAADFPAAVLAGELLLGDIRSKNGRLYILDGENDAIHLFD